MESERATKKPNIYEKLQECRADLSKTKFTKSGHNTFSNYKYFELGDFLPIVNQLFKDNRLSSEFNLYDKMAILKIIDIDDLKSQIVFKVPIAEAKINGSSPIQALGGQITYLRRYLYINALEIAENDMVNPTGPTNQNNYAEKTLEEINLMTELEKVIIDYNINRETIYHKFNVDSLSDLNEKQLNEAIKTIREWKQKKEGKYYE